VKTLVRKKLRLIPQKSHNNARDCIQYNKCILSIGHWNNQSIVPINSWKSNHARDVVLTKMCVGTHPKIAILKQLQTHFKTKREKGVGTPFSRIPAPLHPRNIYSSMWTFYFLSTLAVFNTSLVQRKTKTWKNQEKKFEHKMSQKLQFWHLLRSIID